MLEPEKLAQVLADVHTAEVVIESNYGKYPSDSSRMTLKQAIFQKHGITQETFDTTLVWYGHNIDKYLDVYDRTIDILQQRSNQAGTLDRQLAMSMAGDSVDLWNGPRTLIISDRIPSKRIVFDLTTDDTWNAGDAITMRAKFHDASNDAYSIWTFVANYDDGTSEILDLKVNLNQKEWSEISFVSDSTKNLTRIRGGFEPKNYSKNGEDLWIDSISVVRKHASDNIMHYRYRQRQFRPF